MNIVKIHNKTYKYESFWKESKNKNFRDSKNNTFPWPIAEKNKWQNQEMFETKLLDTQNIIKNKNQFKKYKKNDIDYEKRKDCLICGKKDITTGMFGLNNIRWEDGLLHYISVHNIKPSYKFIDAIFRYDPNPSVVSRTKINGKIIIKNNEKYLKLDRNQILIMDSLMQHGSKQVYFDKRNNKVFRYSEHAGLLDFNERKLERVLVYGNTKRVDQYDSDIYLPGDIAEAMDYEYIFHTHPATPKPGGRAKIGILYEFPSIGDMFHFLDHYNEGKTQGSIVIAAEGMYIIRKLNRNNKKIKINEDTFYKKFINLQSNIQDKAIKKYGTRFSNNVFYSTIAQNKSYIDELNKLVNKHEFHIDYYPRIKDSKGNWIIDTIYLPVYSVEPKK